MEAARDRAGGCILKIPFKPDNQSFGSTVCSTDFCAQGPRLVDPRFVTCAICAHGSREASRRDTPNPDPKTQNPNP